MVDRITQSEFRQMRSSASGTSLREIAGAALSKSGGENAQPAPSNARKIASPKPPTEHEEQAALFDWAAEHADKRLEMLFAIPNGAGVNHQHSRNGKRFSLEGAKLKREGMKQGVPDVFLACPSKVNHVWKNGLFIEMKRAKKSLSRVTPEQLQWKAALEAMGYCVAVCYGADEAKAAIENYLGVTA